MQITLIINGQKMNWELPPFPVEGEGKQSLTITILNLQLPNDKINIKKRRTQRI